MVQYRSLVPGGFFSSDPFDRSVPASIRTNNPGALNIAKWVKRYPGFVDASLTTPGNKTVIFEAPEYGVAAWWELMRRYRKRLGESKFTLKRIIYRYSGRGREAEALAYLQFVSARTGLRGSHVVDLEDFPGLVQIARAFFRYEAGRETPLKKKQILYGFEFASDRSATARRIPIATAKFAESLDKGKIIAANVMPATGESAEPFFSRRQALADLAKQEASKNLKWSGPKSEAEKYLAPLREPMRRLGHIGKKPVFYDWCAAFVTWNCRKVGYAIPDQPVGWWATMALVESWKYWGKQQGILIRDPRVRDLTAGDVLLYEWFDGDRSLDHIGVFLEPSGSKTVKAAEGNKANRSMVLDRNIKNIKGVVRLPH